MSQQLKSLLLATGLVATLGAAQAQTSLPSVEVNASRAADLRLPPRVDVSQVCAGYGDTLRDNLSLPAVDSPVDLLVHFRLHDGAITRVAFRQTPYDWQRTIRRAMWQVSCRDDGQANQQFAFVIRVMPEEAGQPQSVAVDTHSPLLVALETEH